MATQCVNTKKNADRCSCTYTSCQTQPMCCECIHKHLAAQQLPGCCFPPEVEKTYDRSFKRFVEVYQHLLS